MVTIRKKRNHQKKQLRQFGEALKNFVIASNNNVCNLGYETLTPGTDGHYNDPEGIVDGEISACQIRSEEKIIYEKRRKVVEKAVMTIEICMHDANLTTMENVIFSGVEMAVISITSS